MSLRFHLVRGGTAITPNTRTRLVDNGTLIVILAWERTGTILQPRVLCRATFSGANRLSVQASNRLRRNSAFKKNGFNTRRSSQTPSGALYSGCGYNRIECPQFSNQWTDQVYAFSYTNDGGRTGYDSKSVSRLCCDVQRRRSHDFMGVII